MNLSALDYILWAAGFFTNAILLTVLLCRSRWKGSPVFTIYINFDRAKDDSCEP